MSLNITLAGTIYDKGGNSVDAKVQVFVYNSNNELTKWSDIRDTEDTDYNINLGDSDLSGNDNTLGLNNVVGEYALISVWVDGSRTDEDNPPSQMAFIVQEMKGDDVYLQDIMMKTPDPISCSNWMLPEKATTEETIIAINDNTNEFSYIEYDKEHFVYHKYFDINEVIFECMGAYSVEYDFGAGYSESNVYQELSGGDLEVKIKVKDCYGNESECSKTIKIYYTIHQDFLWTPSNIKKYDEVLINDNTTGDVNQIKDYTYNILLNGDEKIVNGKDISYTPIEFGTIEVKQDITFFNGYEDSVLELVKYIYMENIPPEINLIGEETGDNGHIKYKFHHNGTDEDGYIEKVKWEVWRNNPDADGNDNWSLYYSTGKINDLGPWEYDFTNIVGELKVIATVFDNLDATASQEFLLDNSCDDKLITVNIENVDWTKKVVKLKFDTSINMISFEEKNIKIQWMKKIILHKWILNVIKTPWNTKTEKIEFSYKNCNL